MPELLASTSRDGAVTDAILSPEACRFLADLEHLFGARRRELLRKREHRQREFDAGALPDFLEETAAIRTGDWKVAKIPTPLLDRRVEITGPVDAKMMINALNSGAKVFMGDFEDSLSPTWENVLDGQASVMGAVQGTLTYEHPKKGTYKLNQEIATLILRPRGWHLEEGHFLVDGAPISASLFDFGLAFFHNAKHQLANGQGPYFYLPKIEHYEEAKLWDDVFRYAQSTLDLPVGTIKATVLIETLPAAFQMDEILHSLKDHIVGLNAGRWDYIFSTIKTISSHKTVLPDRGQITMVVPHMLAYTKLLVATCHKRGAFAMGGMSAFIPDRRDAERTEKALAQVRADKQREATDGCDGTWVAHPDLIPIAMEIFDAALGGKPNQLHKQTDANVGAADLLNFNIPDGKVTAEGVAQNIDVGLRYLVAWFSGNGAAAIHGLMEDAATAEISRSQLWQWAHAGTVVAGKALSVESVAQAIDAQAATLATEFGGAAGLDSALEKSVRILQGSVAATTFQPFLTLPAYEILETP